MNDTPVIDMDALSRIASGRGPEAPSVALAAAPQKTYVDMLLNDVPARIRAAEAKISGGDLDGARADISAVDAWTELHKKDLAEFTEFQGTHPIANLVAKTSLGLLSRSYMDKLGPMLTAPETKTRANQRAASLLGGGQDLADMFDRRDAGDSEASLILSSLSGGSAMPQSQTKAPGQRSASVVPSAPVDLEAALKYMKSSMPILTAGLSPESLSGLSLADTVNIRKSLLDNGDRDAGGNFARIVNSAAASSDQSDPAAVSGTMKTAADLVSDAVSAFNARGDAVRTRTASSVLQSLQSLLPGQDLVRSRAQVSGVLKNVGGKLDTFREYGADLSDAQASSLASMLYKTQYKSGAPLSQEEARMQRAVQDANLLASRIKAGDIAALEPGKAGAPAPERAGFDLLAASLQDEVQAAMAHAVSGGGKTEDELWNRAPGIARKLQIMGVEDSAQADNAAKILISAMVSGNTVDVTKLPQLLRNDQLVRQAVTEAAKNGEKDAVQFAKSLGIQLPGTGEEPPKAPEKTPLGRAVDTILSRATAAAIPGAAVDKTGATSEDVMKAAKASANATPDFMFAKGLADISNAREDWLRPGFGDENAVRDLFRDTAAKVIPAMFFEGSEAFEYLWGQVPAKDLGKPEVQKKAVDMAIEAYKKGFGLAAMGSDPGALRDAVSSVIKNQVDQMQEKARASGIAEGTMADALGSKGDEAAKVAHTERREAPTMGPQGIPSAGRTVSDFRVTGETLADRLAPAFFHDVKPAEGQRGFADLAKQKLIRLAALGPDQDKSEAPVDLSVKPVLDFARMGSTDAVLDGVRGLNEVTKRLNQPIADSLKRQVYESLLRSARGSLPEDMVLPAMMSIREMAVSPDFSADDMAKGAAGQIQKIREAREKQLNQLAASKATLVEQARGGGALTRAAPSETEVSQP